MTDPERCEDLDLSPEDEEALDAAWQKLEQEEQAKPKPSDSSQN